MNPNCLAIFFACALLASIYTARAETQSIKPLETPVTIDLRAKAASALKSHGQGHHLTREAWINLANHYTDNKRYLDAAEAWRLIARSREESLGPKSGLTADAYYQLGHMLSREGQLVAAEQALEHCVSLCPIKPDDGGLLLDYYGVLSYVQCELKHWPKARQTCRLWLALRHTHVDTEARAHRCLAIALAGMKSFEAARLEMELAIVADPRWGTTNDTDGMKAQLDYAQILRGGGKLRDSEQVLRAIVASGEKASSMDIPITLRACHELAVCLQLSGNETEAQRYSTRARAGMSNWKEMEPWSAEIDQLYQQLHEKTGNNPSK